MMCDTWMNICFYEHEIRSLDKFIDDNKWKKIKLLTYPIFIVFSVFIFYL